MEHGGAGLLLVSSRRRDSNGHCKLQLPALLLLGCCRSAAGNCLKNATVCTDASGTCDTCYTRTRALPSCGLGRIANPDANHADYAPGGTACTYYCCLANDTHGLGPVTGLQLIGAGSATSSTATPDLGPLTCDIAKAQTNTDACSDFAGNCECQGFTYCDDQENCKYYETRHQNDYGRRRRRSSGQRRCFGQCKSSWWLVIVFGGGSFCLLVFVAAGYQQQRKRQRHLAEHGVTVHVAQAAGGHMNPTMGGHAVQVQVPMGAGPGTVLQVPVNGQNVQVTVPRGVRPGSIMSVPAPAIMAHPVMATAVAAAPAPAPVQATTSAVVATATATAQPAAAAAAPAQAVAMPMAQHGGAPVVAAATVVSQRPNP